MNLAKAVISLLEGPGLRESDPLQGINRHLNAATQNLGTVKSPKPPAMKMNVPKPPKLPKPDDPLKSSSQSTKVKTPKRSLGRTTFGKGAGFHAKFNFKLADPKDLGH